MTERSISASAVRTAVALATRAALAPDVPREDVLGSTDPGEALAAMEVITAGVLEGVWPGDNGAGVLARMGLALAELEGGGGVG
jgi:hypothetical protein